MSYCTCGMSGSLYCPGMNCCAADEGPADTEYDSDNGEGLVSSRKQLYTRTRKPR